MSERLPSHKGFAHLEPNPELFISGGTCVLMGLAVANVP